METAKHEITKLISVSARDQATVRKAVLHLNEGLKNIATHQKHIKIADWSELSWQVVAAYESDELASNSDDEK